jgi:hypothetical protein
LRVINLAPGQVGAQFVRDDPAFRAGLTRGHLRDVLAGRGEAAVTLLHQPVLALRVGGAPIYVEADLLGHTSTDVLRPVEIRPHPCVDGVAEQTGLVATAREVAVHVLAVRELASRLGHDPGRVATAGLLVLPRDFTLVAAGQALDVAPQVRRLQRTLAAFPAPPALARQVPASVALPAMPEQAAAPPAWDHAAAQAVEAVSALPARFGDGCSGCPLFRFCRSEQQAAGSVARLGSAALNLCGEIGTVAAALDLAHGRRVPTSATEQAVGAELGRAATLINWVR